MSNQQNSFMRSLYILLLLCISNVAHAQYEILRWGFTPYHPYMYQNANGEMRGSWARKVETVAEKANIMLTPVKFEVEQMRSRLDDESVHFYTGIMKLIEGSDDFLVSDKPILSIELIAYSNNTPSEVKQLTDLRGKSVIVVKGLTYSGIRDWIDDPKNNVTIAHEITDYDDAFKKLKKLKNGYFLGYRAPATTALRFLPQYIKRDLKETTFEKFPRYVFIRKSFPNAEDIMNRINAALPE